MLEWLQWFTQMENSKPLALVLFFAAFCGVVIYIFTNKKRARRLESYKNIPFQDETDETDTPKVSEDERKN